MQKKTPVLFLIAAVIALFVSEGPLAEEAKTKVLKYDDKGKSVGVRATGGKSKKEGKKESKAAPKPSAAAKTTKKSAKAEDEKFNPEEAYEKGEILVINPPIDFSSGARSMGFRIIEKIKISKLKINIVRLRTPSGVDAFTALQQLRRRYPRIDADLNRQFDPSAGVEFPKKVARSLIRWNKAPETCGTGVRLGMIDTSLDLNHPALKGQKITYKSFHSAGRKEGPKDHGTAVASIMVGTPEWGGLLPGARLFAANMFELNEKGRKVGNLSGLLKAISWMFQENVHIINLSFAGADNKVMRKVFSAVQKQKLVMVAAVGNWGRSDVPAYPAAYKDVIGVTGISDRGLAYAKANSGKFVDFAAPGVRVYTAATGGSGRLRTGTSFAAPFITALMGLEIAKGRAKSSSELTALLKKNVKDLGSAGRDKIYGWGFTRHKPKC